MKKRFMRISAAALALLMAFSCMAVAAEITDTPESSAADYTIVSPYADVIWDGDNAWGAYKGNLHTHSFASDADVDYKDMILAYYEQGFDFLAMTDHGVTGKPWNEKPTELPLYLYQRIIGNNVTYLSDEEFLAVTSGTHPLAETGAARGYGMVCVTGGNELNALTATKDHVNAIFLPENVGNNFLGFENDYESAVKLAHDAGAVSFINHPGDWLDSSGNRDAVSDPWAVNYFADILLRYNSCLGMEVFNEKNSTTPYDRVLWDNLLMACLPYGKTVIGFANGDTHAIYEINSSFSIFMMEENTVENIRKTMSSGAFFMTTRRMKHDDLLGPKEDFDRRESFLPYPTFSSITVDGHTVTVSAENYNNIQWVADGKVISTQDITQTGDTTVSTLNLDEIAGAGDFTYIRCQLIGEDGITLTQAFAIDDGSEPLTYEPDTSFEAILDKIIYKFFSLRFFVLLNELWKAIAD